MFQCGFMFHSSLYYVLMYIYKCYINDINIIKLFENVFYSITCFEPCSLLPVMKL